uniref:Uncharacterized protein n=1 Tax=Ascaris lumbricoides TaxID=6252 RepID=A0A0M3HM12_ASCLU
MKRSCLDSLISIKNDELWNHSKIMKAGFNLIYSVHVFPCIFHLFAQV